MADSERIDGKTPHGGDYAIAYFSDSSGNPVEKDAAAKIEIVEYKNDEEIFRTYLTK